MSTTETKVRHTPSESHIRGGHAFNTARQCPECPGRVFHYSCIDCGVDCTAGTKHGPSHSDSRKQYRCQGCHLEDAKRVSILNAAAPDMLKALEGLQKAIRDAGLLDVKKQYSLCVADAVACTAIHKARGEA